MSGYLIAGLTVIAVAVPLAVWALVAASHSGRVERRKDLVARALFDIDTVPSDLADAEETTPGYLSPAEVQPKRWGTRST